MRPIESVSAQVHEAIMDGEAPRLILPDAGVLTSRGEPWLIPCAHVLNDVASRRDLGDRCVVAYKAVLTIEIASRLVDGELGGVPVNEVLPGPVPEVTARGGELRRGSPAGGDLHNHPALVPLTR